MRDDDDALYKINIQWTVSPSELRDFEMILETEGYDVVTDLSVGKIEVYDEGDD